MQSRRRGLAAQHRRGEYIGRNAQPRSARWRSELALRLADRFDRDFPDRDFARPGNVGAGGYARVIVVCSPATTRVVAGLPRGSRRSLGSRSSRRLHRQATPAKQARVRRPRRRSRYVVWGARGSFEMWLAMRSTLSCVPCQPPGFLLALPTGQGAAAQATDSSDDEM